jgi:hypothetical protein
MGNEELAYMLVRVTGIHLSARCSGGRIIQTWEKDSYKVFVHRPVFDGIFQKRSTGFIQVDFVQTTLFPPKIIEKVSYNRSVPRSFEIRVTTAPPHAEIISADPHMLGLSTLAIDAGKIMLRVKLKR